MGERGEEGRGGRWKHAGRDEKEGVASKEGDESWMKKNADPACG